MKLSTILPIAAALAMQSTTAQLVGTNQREVHPSLPSKTCTKSSGCVTEQTKIVIDANWRWLHKADGYTNCYTGNTWDTSICPDPATCTKNCAIEGANYQETYGIQTQSDQVTLKFVNQHAYGKNIGSRIYLLQDDNKYKMFKLLNKEFTFDVDVSQLECGLNGALYFVQMDEDGGMAKYPSNRAGAKYGTGYCDAQCPHDIKYINGEANILDWTPSSNDPNAGTGRYGSCCMEFDIWESNKISQAYTSHPCKLDGQYRCSGTECGDTKKGERYHGVCDKDGCDINPFRMNDKSFYGPGSGFKIDSTQPMTVVTQFITSDGTDHGDLVEVRRLYKQNGQVIENTKVNWPGIDPVNSISDNMCSQAKTTFSDPDDHSAKGGLKKMGEALRNGVVLTMSLWDDHEVNCLWLDSNYPLDRDPSAPGVARGTCATSSGVPSEVEAQYPNAVVKYSNLRVGELDSTY